MRFRSHTAVLGAMGMLLVVLTGADFAIDRLFDDALADTLEKETDRVMRITVLRKAARRAYVDALERRLLPRPGAPERTGLSPAADAVASLPWGAAERPAAEALVAATRELGRALAADGPPLAAVPPRLPALVGEIDALSARLLARDDPRRVARDELILPEELNSGLSRLHLARLVEQFGLSLALIAAMTLGLAWTRRVERLRAEKDAADRSRAEIQRMAGILAHEVNGQLGVLQNAHALLERAAPGDAALRVQQESVEHMRTLVADFRLFGDPPSLHLADTEAIEIARGAAVALGLAVEISGPREAPLRADAQALQRALQNLLRNAAQAGGPVRLSVEAGEGAVRFIVEDEGPGLAPGVAARAGEPFFTTRAGGTGLGLAIVKEIAVRHGGAFSLRDRPGGRGARAELLVPARGPGRG